MLSFEASAAPGVGTSELIWTVERDGVAYASGTGPLFDLLAGDHGDYLVKVTSAQQTPERAYLASESFVFHAANSRPAITSSAIASVAENQLLAIDVDAVDVGAKTTLTYTITGPDSALFDIGAATGTVTFKTNPNFEAPSDLGADNVYNFTVTVSDGNLTATQEIAITVTDVNESPVSLALLGDTITENNAIAAVVGAFSSIDPDVGNTFTYSFVSGLGSSNNTSFTIDGNQIKAAASFDFETKDNYTIRVRSTDQGGLFTEQTFTISVTDVVEDVTAPVSAVNALAANATSLSITVTAGGADPMGAFGSTASGIKEYDLYVAIDSGAFTKFATVPVNSPAAVYVASSHRTYYFRSIAKDHAGNVEVKAANAADAFTRTADLDKPVTQVNSANPTAGGLFTLAFSGTELGGSQLTAFDLYVSIGGAVAASIGSVAGGTPVSGVYSATTTYQGLTDGNPHTYRFHSRGRDSSGNVEDAPAVADRTTIATFAAPAALQATGIDVQRGANQRSYITDVDLLFNTSTGINAIRSNRVDVERFDLLATNVTPGNGSKVRIASVAQNPNDPSKLRVNFGSALANDGFYRIRVDANNDGDYDDAGESFEFHRLLGDANGDAKVNAMDTSVIDSFFGRSGYGLDGDLNGDGVVNSTDKSFSLRTYRLKELLFSLRSLLDD